MYKVRTVCENEYIYSLNANTSRVSGPPYDIKRQLQLYVKNYV